MRQIYTTTLRLNLADEDERRAFEYLRGMDKKKHRSYSKAVAAAVNDYFERQERTAADPYLETREKEDAFLKKVMRAVEQGLQRATVGTLPLANSAVEVPPSAGDEENISAALDFADGF